MLQEQAGPALRDVNRQAMDTEVARGSAVTTPEMVAATQALMSMSASCEFPCVFI